MPTIIFSVYLTKEENNKYIKNKKEIKEKVREILNKELRIKT